MTFQRTGGPCAGEDRCGGCCGAAGSPNQANPWPRNWFEHHRQWRHADFQANWSYATLFGIIAGPDGKPLKQQDYGNVRFVGGGPARNYYWVWKNGQPCKDTSVAHDGSAYSLECPFLADDPGDGSRPCGLVGESEEPRYQTTCFPEGPLEFADQRSVDQWKTDHPLCVFDWVEV